MRKIYSLIRNVLSPQLRGYLTLVLYFFGLKPKVQRVKSSLKRGVVVFSADFEMAWAFRFSKRSGTRAVEKGLLERNNVPRILELFDKYNIPCTWATVGHLMLQSCNSEEGIPHAHMPRPDFFENKNWIYRDIDWYHHDPVSCVEKDPAWYAPDLVNSILKAPVGHELGCHTFSHIDMTYKNCPRMLAEAELGECKKQAENFGVELKSMVFPGGTLGNFETLKAEGFTCYRKPLDYHVGLPIKDDFGLWAIHSSLGLDKSAYNWKKETYIRIAKQFVRKAIKNRMVIHFWFHPSMDPWYLEFVFPEILALINKYALEGKLETLTMAQLADRMNND